MSDLERKSTLASCAVAAVSKWARGLLALTIIWAGGAAAQSASSPAATASALPQTGSSPISAPVQGPSANPSTAPAQQPAAQPAAAGVLAPSPTPAAAPVPLSSALPALVVPIGGSPAICAADRAAAEKAIVSGSALPVASDVPAEAEKFCPPFPMAQVTDCELVRLSDVLQGQDFSFRITVIGGTGPYEWRLKSNNADAGLKFGPDQGNSIQQTPSPATDILGNASLAKEYQFSVTVTDGTGTTKVRNFTFTAN